MLQSVLTNFDLHKRGRPPGDQTRVLTASVSPRPWKEAWKRKRARSSALSLRPASHPDPGKKHGMEADPGKKHRPVSNPRMIRMRTGRTARSPAAWVPSPLSASPYGQFSWCKSGKVGPAPGSFELSKTVLKWTRAMVLRFETLNSRRESLRSVLIITII